MNPEMMESMTDAAMYRASFGTRVPVYPRHYRHFAVVKQDDKWTPCPLASDDQVEATLKAGNNMERYVAEVMAYYWDRTGKTEPDRVTFGVVYCYLLHYVFAPAWTKAHDEWRVKAGLGELGLTEIFDKLGELLLEVETPAEMLQWIRMALDAGVDCLSPPTAADVEGLITMQRTDRKPGS